MVSSTIFTLRLPGINPAPSPCNLCGPGAPPEMTGDFAGSTATALNDGFRCLMTSATPVMVPPVPTPATRKSTLPSVSRQISSAVVRRWMAGLAGLENCWGMKLFGICCFNSSARAIAPFMPLAPSVSTSLAPRIFNSLRRSRLIVSGMVRINFNPLAAATNASAMPVLPLVGSISTVSWFIFPDFRASSIMAMPMRSLTLDNGLKNSSLSNTSATAPCFLAVRFNRTSGVLPMVSVMSLWILLINLKVGRVGNEFAVFGQNCLQRRQECQLLQVRRRRFGGFQNHLKRTWTHFRRRAQHAVVSVADDPVPRLVAVNDRALVTRSEER